RDVRYAPCMHVEHGRDRHVDVVFVEATVAGSAERVGGSEGVQDELAVAEEDALGQPRRASRVEGRRASVLVECRKLVVGVRGGEKRLVLARERQRGCYVRA